MYAGILQGTTARLKQLIREHGQIWMTESTKPIPMQCFNGREGFAIVSENGRHARNVLADDYKVPYLYGYD